MTRSKRSRSSTHERTDPRLAARSHRPAPCASATTASLCGGTSASGPRRMPARAQACRTAVRRTEPDRYFDSISGVGQSARCLAAAAEAAGVGVRRIDAQGAEDPPTPGPTTSTSTTSTPMRRLRSWRLGTAAPCGPLERGYGTGNRTASRAVGRPVHYFDEIWVASEFCRSAIAQSSPLPIHRVPPAVPPPAASSSPVPKAETPRPFLS